LLGGKNNLRVLLDFDVPFVATSPVAVKGTGACKKIIINF
jgi:hypothetical protein